MSSARQELLRLLAAKSFRAGRIQAFVRRHQRLLHRLPHDHARRRGARLTGEVFSRKFGARLEAAGDRRTDHGRRSDRGRGFGGERRRSTAFWFARRRSSTARASASKVPREGARGGDRRRCLHTGASTVQAIEAAREFGFEVVGRDVPGRTRRGRAAAPAWRRPPRRRPSSRSSPPTMCAQNTSAE